MSDDRIFAKCAWRLIPLLLAAYIANYVDRTLMLIALSLVLAAAIVLAFGRATAIRKRAAEAVRA